MAGLAPRAPAREDGHMSVDRQNAMKAAIDAYAKVRGG